MILCAIEVGNEQYAALQVDALEAAFAIDDEVVAIEEGEVVRQIGISY